MDENCIFCKIANGIIPSDYVYEDEKCVVINDLNPMAPVHMLVLPKKHIQSLAQTEDGDAELLGHLLRVAAIAAEKRGIAGDGYRTIINTGKNGCQSVQHLHVHVLGGALLAEKMC